MLLTCFVATASPDPFYIIVSFLLNIVVPSYIAWFYFLFDVFTGVIPQFTTDGVAKSVGIAGTFKVERVLGLAQQFANGVAGLLAVRDVVVEDET